MLNLLSRPTSLITPVPAIYSSSHPVWPLPPPPYRDGCSSFGAASLFNEPFSRICFNGVSDHPELLVKTLSRGERYSFPPSSPRLLRSRKTFKLSSRECTQRHGMRVCGCVYSRSRVRDMYFRLWWSVLRTRHCGTISPSRSNGVCLKHFIPECACRATTFPVDYARCGAPARGVVHRVICGRASRRLAGRTNVISPRGRALARTNVFLFEVVLDAPLKINAINTVY